MGLFQLRLDQITILDNRESKFLGIFGRDLAEVTFLSFVTTSDVSFIDLSALLEPRVSDEEKRKLVSKAVAAAVSDRVIGGIHHVKDRQRIRFGDTGLAVHQASQIPPTLHWNLIAIETDQDVRDTGSLINGVLGHKDFDSFTKGVGALIGAAANPQFTAAIAVVEFVTAVIGDTLTKNRDDQLGYYAQTMTRVEHYPNGKRMRDDVPDATGNMLVDYTIFGYEEPTLG